MQCVQHYTVSTSSDSACLSTLHVEAMPWCQYHEGQRDDMTISSLQLPWKQEQMGYM